VLKCFLRERGNLDKTKKGGVCSFMLINMIVGYLQMDIKEALSKDAVIPDTPLHKHLLQFFCYFGIRLNNRETGLSIREGGFLYGKSEDDLMQGRAGFTRLNVESPLNRLEDVGAGAYSYSQVKKHFKLAHDLIYSYAPLSQSLLTLILSDKLLMHFAAQE
jgi:DNA polymerase sigma